MESETGNNFKRDDEHEHHQKRREEEGDGEKVVDSRLLGLHSCHGISVIRIHMLYGHTRSDVQFLVSVM